MIDFRQAVRFRFLRVVPPMPHTACAGKCICVSLFYKVEYRSPSPVCHISEPAISSSRYLVLFGVVVTVLGCALRIAGARGDLWLDEVHSLMLTQSIHRADEVFWHINHDNNHFLTTLYLFIVGPGHSSVVLRAESILLSTLSIPAAGLAAFQHHRRNWVAAAVAMLLCAILYPAVHYGSEARGYAGLTLFSFLAINVVEGGLNTTRRQVLLGLIILAGVLSHLLMAFFACELMLWRLAVSFNRESDLFALGFSIMRQFWCAVSAILCVIICIKIGSLHHSFITNNGTNVSSYVDMIANIDQFLKYSFGISFINIRWMGLTTLVFLIMFSKLFANYYFSGRRKLYIVIFPAQILWYSFAGLQGYEAPRYSMPMLAPLVLLVADCLGYGLRTRRYAQAAAVLCLSCLCIGTIAELTKFYADGRGHYSDAVKVMTKYGTASFTSDVNYGISEVVEHYADKLGVNAVYIPFKDTCVIPPDWFLKGKLEPSVPENLILGPSGCLHTYRYPQVFTFWGLAGWTWILYRRVD